MSSVKTRSIGNQFGWLLLGRVISAGLQALSLTVVARLASIEDFALCSGFLGASLFVQMLFDFGISTYIIKEHGRDRSSAILAAAMQIYNYISLSLVVVSGILLLVLATTLNDTFYMLLPGAIWVGAERNADTWLGIYISDGHAAANALQVGCRRLAAFVILAGLSVYLDVVLAYSVSLAASSLAAAVLAQRLIAPRLVEKAGTRAMTVLRAAWPFWVNSAATQLRNLDVVIVGVMAGSAATALFALPVRLLSPLRMITTTMSVSLLPVVAAGTVSLRSIRRALLGVWATVSVIYLLLIMLAPSVITVLVGEKYADSVPVFQVMVLGLIPASLASLLSSIFQGLELQRFVGFVALLATIAYLAGVSIGAVLEGAMGAAIGTVVAYVVQCIALCTKLNQVRGMKAKLLEVSLT